MKLDRNINLDGVGKYALLKIRSVDNLRDKRFFKSIERSIRLLDKHGLLHYGNEGNSPGEMFFVMKYKDKFSAPALLAYSKAVMTEAFQKMGEILELAPGSKKALAIMEYRSMMEFAREIHNEYLIAVKTGNRIPD